jgi:hypothetical protein
MGSTQAADPALLSRRNTAVNGAHGPPPMGLIAEAVAVKK